MFPVKRTILRAARGFRAAQGGATAIEYALIAGLIFLAVVGGINSYASNMGGMYGKIETAMINK
ncbi:hypothetical protein ASG40_02435 [Methylobacterium sp. Leaf399]|nr:hypothetical protein ASF39_02420 [Methylobacterium sp. Leaf108]KQT19704.1 hypothetical protein ASG40_02435 [Methylobacterium sp. Leaf399]KQT80754.1 hypothetical protein ASG59_04855 [Methylobacterium sp. Leaf466]